MRIEASIKNRRQTLNACAGQELDTASTLLEGRRGDLLAVLIPVLQFAQFHIVGTLYATDLLSLSILLCAGLSNIHVLNRPLPRRFLAFGTLWLIAQVATDLIRATPFTDLARGWAMIGFTFVNFAALYLLLYDSRRRIMLCASGFVVGDLLAYFFHPGDIGASAALSWKFGYGYEVTLLIVLFGVFLMSRGRGGATAVMMMMAAALNLYEGSRSLSGICFVTAAYLLLPKPIQNDGQRTDRTNVGRAFAICGAFAIAGVSLFQIYAYCAIGGLLGSKAQAIYDQESSGSYGVLVGGRTEFFTGLEAAVDSPIIGHGSWAKDWRYASRVDSLREDLGYEMNGGSSEYWLIPSHSYLIGAWVDAGIIGALFWIWVLSLPLRILAQLYAVDEPQVPLVAFLASGFLWDILFSPFGAAQRFSAAFAAVTLIWFRESQYASVRPAASNEPFADEFFDSHSVL